MTFSQANASSMKQKFFRKRILKNAQSVSGSSSDVSQQEDTQSNNNIDKVSIPFKRKIIRKTGLQKLKISPKIIAEGHRGTGILMVENTLSCFRRSIELGLDSIELDIWLTSDNHIIVVHGEHDDTLILNDKSHRKINEMSLEEIRNLVTLPQNQQIPLLSEVFSLCKGVIHVNIEIKGKEEVICCKVIELAEEYGVIGQIHFSSFLHFHQKHLLEALKSKNLPPNTIPFGYLIWQHEDFDHFDSFEYKDNILAFPSDFIFDDFALPYLFKAKERGMRLSVYFSFEILENTQIYNRICKIGIETIITNQPNSLLCFLRKNQNNNHL